MSSVQAESSSTRLSAELDTDSHMPDINQHGASSPSPLPNILAQLGGRFAADVADILQKLPENTDQQKNTLHLQHSELINKETHEHQQFALVRLRARNIQGAVDYIQRHAPELQDWLNSQIKQYAPHYHHKKSQKSNLSTSIHLLQQDVRFVPDGILIDAEAGRIARILTNLAYFGHGHTDTRLMMEMVGLSAKN